MVCVSSFSCVSSFHIRKFCFVFVISLAISSLAHWFLRNIFFNLHVFVNFRIFLLFCNSIILCPKNIVYDLNPFKFVEAYFLVYLENIPCTLEKAVHSRFSLTFSPNPFHFSPLSIKLSASFTITSHC